MNKIKIGSNYLIGILIFIYFFLIFFSVSQAQNIVDNPSFENVIENKMICDHYCKNSEEFNQQFRSGWTNAGNGTSDVYSLLVTRACEAYAFPNPGIYGEQLPRTDSVMVGM